MRLRIWLMVVVSAGATVAAACSSDDNSSAGTTGSGAATTGSGAGTTGSGGSSVSSGNSGSSGTGTIVGSGGATGGGTAGTSGGGGPPAPMQDPDGNWICTAADGSTHPCQCSDGMDNDGDQAIDTLDPNCNGAPYNDSEAGTAGGGNCGTTACSNCLDDDGDGLIDSADIACTGALDNDESSFATGISGDNSDACKQDCFFDGNSGSGNDGCLWDLRCDPESPGSNAEKMCPYDATYNNCSDTQSDKCLNNCRPFTPNGCDCFGCCSVFVNDVEHVVKLQPGCAVENIDDATLCPTCTKTTACSNDCMECEYCLGKAPPPSCNPPPDGGTGGTGGTGGGGNTEQCPAGVTACTPGVNECPSAYYCVTGCCSPVIK